MLGFLCKPASHSEKPSPWDWSSKIVKFQGNSLQVDLGSSPGPHPLYSGIEKVAENSGRQGYRMISQLGDQKKSASGQKARAAAQGRGNEEVYGFQPDTP